MFNQVTMYTSLEEFNQDARDRHRQAASEAGPMGYPCWWKVEHVIHVQAEKLIVVWSRPTPLKHR